MKDMQAKERQAKAGPQCKQVVLYCVPHLGHMTFFLLISFRKQYFRCPRWLHTTPETATPEILRIFCQPRFLKRWWQRSKEGWLLRKPEPEKRRVRSQEGTGYAQHPTPKCHSVEMFVWHHPRRAGQAARCCSRGPGSGARGAKPAAAVPGEGERGARVAPPAPPRLLPGGQRRGRGREVGA